MFQLDVLMEGTFRAICFITSRTIVRSDDFLSSSAVSLFPLWGLASYVVSELFLCFFFIVDNVLVDFMSFLVEFLHFSLNFFAVGPDI